VAVDALADTTQPDASDAGVDADSGDGNVVCSAADVAAIPDIALWLVGDSVVADASNAVAAWTDQSGKGNNATQTTASLQPLWVSNALNGHSVVRFGSGGTLNDLKVPDNATLQWATDDFAVEIVFRYTGSSGEELIYSKQIQNPSPYPGVGLFGNNANVGAGAFTVQVQDQSGYIAASSARTFNDGMSRLYGGRRTGGTALEARINGAAVGAVVTPTTVNVSAVGVPLSLGLDEANGANQQLIGDIAEVVAIHGTLTTANLACLESYLMAKYAL
jgi:hypothetical protein